MYNARIERCAYPVLNGDESSIFCVSLQVAQKLATTFLRDHQPEPAGQLLKSTLARPT
jgi:hypothetical protein